MEGYCANARNKIITKRPLEIVLSTNAKRLGIKTNLNIEQLATRFETPFRLLGLAQVIQDMPQFQMLGGRAVNPVDAILEREGLGKLYRDKLDQAMDFRPPNYFPATISGAEQRASFPATISGAEQRASIQFLTEQGLLHKTPEKEHHYSLTPKGKHIVQHLLSEIAKIKLTPVT